MSKASDYPTSIRISAELREKLVDLAEADGRTLTNYIANVLRMHVEQLETSARSGKSRKT